VPMAMAKTPIVAEMTYGQLWSELDPAESA